MMRKMFPLIVLLLYVSMAGSDSHSLRYYYTAVSAPGYGLPLFSTVGYVDDREITNYNTDSGRERPRVRWMENVDPGYWERQTQISKQDEPVFRHNVKTVMSRFNQTGGFHILQQMYGCELGDDGSITGYEQHGYDGREFMALDTKTWTYLPTMSQAQITTQRWNSAEEQEGERNKNYLENICIEWLRKYVENGKEDLERRVQPKVKVSGEDKGDTTMLHCQVYGFHPKHVDVKWKKNGKDDVTGYQTTHTLPNPDGTYQIRVSAEVMPKEGDSYSCFVDHSSLKETLNIVWDPNAKTKRGPEEPSGLGTPVIIAVVVVGIVLLGVAVGGYFLYKKKKDGYKTASKKKDGYKTASTSDTSSDSSIPAAKA